MLQGREEKRPEFGVCSIITGHLCGRLAASAMQNLSGQIALCGSFLALHVQGNP
jgi:hypothetical protein